MGLLNGTFGEGSVLVPVTDNRDGFVSSGGLVVLYVSEILRYVRWSRLTVHQSL